MNLKDRYFIRIYIHVLITVITITMPNESSC